MEAPWRRSDEPAQGVRGAGRLKEETRSQTDLLTSGKLNERRAHVQTCSADDEARPGLTCLTSLLQLELPQLAHGKQPVKLPVWSAEILDACGGLDRVQDYLLTGGGGGWDRCHRNHPRRR